MNLALNEIYRIDQKMIESVCLIKKLASDLEFSENFQFKLSDSIPKEKWDSIVYPGIYLIEIKNEFKYDTFEKWVNNFSLTWEHEDYKRKFVPNLKKKRIKEHPELKDWIPLYIGKSKMIGGRFFEHLYQPLDKNLFALKLYARKDLLNNYFRLSTIKIEVQNYDQIIPIIERELRDRINPIIGKQ